MGASRPGNARLRADAASDNLALGDLDGDGVLDISATLSRFFTTGLQPIVGVVELGDVAPGALPWPSGRGGPRNPGSAAPRQ